ncbi:MAG: DHH family phosphoesterase [Lachnospiraceae bacterium]|nr:DHH family phosphoesterase [Lachnospiraceae bacterium]
MKLSKTIKGRIGGILWWPLFLIPAILILGGALYFFKDYQRIIIIVFSGISVLFIAIWIIFIRRHIQEKIVDFAVDFEKMQEEQLQSLVIPCALIDEDGKVFWKNAEFAAIFDEEGKEHEQLQDYSPLIAEFLEKGMPRRKYKKSLEISYNGRDYSLEFVKLKTDRQTVTYAVSMVDMTLYNKAIQTIDDMHPVVVQVCIDNFDEMMNSIEEFRRPLLAAYIERLVSQHISDAKGILNAVSKDKFTAYLDKKSLTKLTEKNFDLLEKVKSVDSESKVSPTLSIGVGMGGSDIAANSELSRQAMDMCQGRGGDQAIIRTPEGSTFFGGKTESMEKSTKVKARSKAQRLREIILSKSRVLVMGHELPDADSLGSAVGIYRIARDLGKEAHIVFNATNSIIRPLYDLLRETEEPDAFISGEEALKMVDDKTVVVMVDLNKPSYSECPELIENASCVVIVDHHRQSGETVRTEMTYIETVASSACEMITELIQYYSDSVKLSAVEADALYSGIIIDTDNFLAKTGARTFEAAAYLRKCGADMTLVRKLFRKSMEEFRAKARTVSTVEIFEQCFALGRCEADGTDSPTIIGAQAANSLLDIKGIKASFVFTQFENRIYISARSIDEVNVQIIMERLGGGGHLSVAGAQLSETTMEEAIEMTKEIIRQMLEEEAI